MTDKFVSDACCLAIDVPARSHSERSAWVCRGLAEVALMIWVSDQKPDELDKAIGETNLIGAPKRFVARLRGLRALLGDVPPFYPTGSEVTLAPEPTSKKVEADALLITELADMLTFKNQKSVDLFEISALRGIGKKNFHQRRHWRPGRRGDKVVSFLEFPDLDTGLLWRAWMTSPSGVTMVVPDERLDQVRMDVWWGVHNGIHLDHLMMRATPGPDPIEFGSGLLIAEALAMSGELLAAIEAFIEQNYMVSSAIAEALVERAGRLNLSERSEAGPSYTRAFLDVSAEFVELPVLSESYVSGPLELIRARHVHPLVPINISNAFDERWAKVANASPIAEAFLTKVFGV